MAKRKSAAAKKKAAKKRAAPAKKPAVPLAALSEYARGEATTYLNRPEVTSVGVGYKIVNGKRTQEPVIQFTVERKSTLEELRRQDIEPLPKTVTINGVQVATDVVERTFKAGFTVLTETTKDPR